MGQRAGARGLSYQVKSREVPGGEFRPFACCSCHLCQAIGEVRLPGHSNNPEAVEQKYRAQGWEFSAWNAREITCPKCIAPRRQTRRGESGRKQQGENVVTLTLKNTPAGAADQASDVRPPNKTELSVEEKARVRTILAGTFDEATGQFSEGWSDLRVAQEAGDLPPKLVADLREIAFGPVRSVSEIETLRTAVTALETKAADEVARITEAVAAEVGNLRQRLDDALRRLGVRS